MNWFFDYIWLALGGMALFSSLWGLASGSILSKYGVYSRAEQPADYWTLVVARAVGGVLLVGVQFWIWNR